MKPCLFLFFVLTFAIHSALGQVFNVKDLDHKGCIGTLPFVSSETNKKAAEKINTYIGVRLLQIVPDNYKKCPFENVYDSSKCCSYTLYSSFEVVQNSNSILSIGIKGETMGAYPEGATWELNFNSVTGDIIYPEEIFTVAGFAAIKQEITNQRRLKVQDYIFELEKGLKNKTLERDDDETKEQIEMYEHCLQYINEDDFDYSNFIITKDAIIFTRQRCSNHAMRAIDDLWEFSDTLLIRDIKGKLNSYGKALFNEDTSPGSDDQWNFFFSKGKLKYFSYYSAED